MSLLTAIIHCGHSCSHTVRESDGDWRVSKAMKLVSGEGGNICCCRSDGICDGLW